MTLSTALGRTNVYRIESMSTGGLRRTKTGPSGLVTVDTTGADGTTTVTSPDGTVVASKSEPDPRFGMAAGVTGSSTVSTPAGLTMTTGTSRTAVLTNPNDKLSVATLTEVTKLNG